jgi:hypothetical protein
MDAKNHYPPHEVKFQSLRDFEEMGEAMLLQNMGGNL